MKIFINTLTLLYKTGEHRMDIVSTMSHFPNELMFDYVAVCTFYKIFIIFILCITSICVVGAIFIIRYSLSTSTVWIPHSQTYKNNIVMWSVKNCNCGLMVNIKTLQIYTKCTQTHKMWIEKPSTTTTTTEKQWKLTAIIAATATITTTPTTETNE